MSTFHIEQLNREWPGNCIPEQLKKLYDFQEANHYYQYSGDFVVDGRAGESLSRGPQMPNRASFAGFGSDYCGGIFALWSGGDIPLTSDRLEYKPIVYIDSEAVYSSVITQNFLEFVSLLLLANSDLGGQAAREEEILPSVGNNETQCFRDWALTTFSIAVPTTPLEIVRGAKSMHQDEFFRWFKKWQRVDPWTLRA